MYSLNNAKRFFKSLVSSITSLICVKVGTAPFLRLSIQLPSICAVTFTITTRERMKASPACVKNGLLFDPPSSINILAISDTLPEAFSILWSKTLIPSVYFSVGSITQIISSGIPILCNMLIVLSAKFPAGSFT